MKGFEISNLTNPRQRMDYRSKNEQPTGLVHSLQQAVGAMGIALHSHQVDSM